MTDKPSPFKILSDIAASFGLQVYAKASQGGDDFELIVSSPSKWAEWPSPNVTWNGDIARIEEGATVRYARVVEAQGGPLTPKAAASERVVAGVDKAAGSDRTVLTTMETGPRTSFNTFTLENDPNDTRDPYKLMEAFARPLVSAAAEKTTEPPDVYRAYLDGCGGPSITIGRTADPPIEVAIASAIGAHDRRTNTPPCSRAVLLRRIEALAGPAKDK